MSRQFALFVLVVLYGLGRGSAQTTDDKRIFLTPGISAGYTFGAKFNFGFLLDAGLIKTTSKNFEWRYGLSFYQYYVFTKKHIHRLRSFSLMAQTDYVDLKVGIGRVRNKWGRSHDNRCITHGISYDVSFAWPSIYSPWIGYRRFVYRPSSWSWFLTPYNSVYVKYKFDVIQNTQLRNTVRFD